MIAVGRTICALALMVGALVVAPLSSGGLPTAEAASLVPREHCRSLDPNLVRGACLRYRSRSGAAYTWIGTYRASNGRIFFCIDYLYDSGSRVVRRSGRRAAWSTSWANGSGTPRWRR